MRRSVLAISAALLLAGCIGGLTSPESDGSTEPTPDLGGPIGAVDISTTWPGAEPVIDAGPQGTLYVEGVGTYQPDDGPSRGVNKVFRSLDRGETWTDVTPQGPGQEETGDGYLAVGPDGTVYAANVFGLTFQVYRSTDRGESWTPLNVPRLPLLMHRHWIEPTEDAVHVTVEALAPGAVPFLLGGPTLEGQADHPNTGMYYFRSTDDGETWTTPERIDPKINYVGQSDMALGPDGESIFVVRYEEPDETAPLHHSYDDGVFYLLASTDGGDSWERKEMFELEAPIGSALTSLSVDDEGRLQFVWAEMTGNRSKIHLATSADAGDSWDQRVLDVGDGTQAMPFATSLEGDRLALVWYEAHAPGNPVEVDADWHVHTAVLDDVSAEPTVAATWTTAETVHRGNICVYGPACGDGEDRRLLDYPWVTTGPAGQIHAAWASTMWDRPSAHPVYGAVGDKALGR